MFPKDNYFLQLLAYGRDKSQKYHIIKFINKSQYYLLKKIAKKYIRRSDTFEEKSIETSWKLKNIYKIISRRKSKKFRFTSLLYNYMLHC